MSLRPGKPINTLVICIVLLMLSFRDTGLLSAKTSASLRVVSTSLASDEVLVQLLEDGCENFRIEALSHLADHPRYSNIVEQSKKFPIRVSNNIEKLVSLNPSFVITSSFNNPILLQGLKKLKVKTFQLEEFRSLADIQANIKKIGSWTGCQKHAQGILKKINTTKKSLTRPKKVRTVLGFTSGPTAIGTDTIFHSILSLAGAHNVMLDKNLSGWIKLNPEAVLAMNPHVLVTSAGTSKEINAIHKNLKNLPGWKDLEAVKKKRIIFIRDRELSATSHHVMKAAAEINRRLRAILQ